MNLLSSTLLVGKKSLLPAALLAGIFASSAMAQAPAPEATPGPVAKAEPDTHPQFELGRPKRERGYYQLFWGVDTLHVKAVESGELIKFSYRVLDADKAKTLNDKENTPEMYVPALHAKLVIPSLEKVGQLRQASTPEPGRIYWMAFSNPGRVVKKGDRVTVVIGKFHIDGMIVE